MPGSSDGLTFITVYGRNPVLEALGDERITFDKVLLARNATGDSVDEIVRIAAQRGVRLQRVSPEKVTRISRNGRHDQGVVADIVAPGVLDLEAWLADASNRDDAGFLVVLDGVTNPANVGMVLRTATAAGASGVVLPRMGSPDLGPLVIKASAGVAFRATVLRSATGADAVAQLRAAGWPVFGLRGHDAQPLFSADLPERAAYVLGSETDGVSEPVGGALSGWVRIPMAEGVESLNVAVAAGVLTFELARRRMGAPG